MLIHVDDSGEDVFRTDLLLEEFKRPLEIAANLFGSHSGEKLRRGGDDGVDKFHAVLPDLALRIFPLRSFNAGLNFSIIL